MSAAVQRPRLVVITGEPGSGKTTLGHELARALRVPFLARDDVRAGLFVTRGAWFDRPGTVPEPDEAVEAFLRIVETMVGEGVSCVVEYVIRRDRPEPLQRLTADADCVVLTTWCREPLERFAARNRADRLLNRPAVLEALGFATIDEHTASATERMRAVAREMQVEFEQPSLRVNTDDGYVPGLDDIVDFVVDPTG